MSQLMDSSIARQFDRLPPHSVEAEMCMLASMMLDVTKDMTGQIVQMVVPASAMESFGIAPFAAGGDAVSADVFVGDDGLARAVRFSPLTPKEFVP